MLTLDLDKKNDILYIKVGDMSFSYGDEIENGLVIFRDINSREITGITIFDFKQKCNKGVIDQIHLPIEIDINKDILTKLQ